MSRLLRTVVLLVVGALALSGCDFSVYSLPLPGGADVGKNPYTVKVEFRDVLDLVPQSSVKVDDVAVGRVDDIKVDGYHAVVTLQLRRSVKLPDNAVATIRQTSLLGEKFVSLAPPGSGASTGRLGNGDVIPLSRSGRNPEVEEVLGALSLLLNGGGVAQLKTISTELNKALGGRESDVRSVLTQLRVLTTRLDDNKDVIVRAIESLNRLSIALNKQKPAITAALDQLPRAVASINRQRDDLVRMLRALSRLSSVGTRVIAQSKAGTIASLRALAPTLTKLADTGQALPKALQVFLTYPFVDAVVGTNPAQARNLHVGDYTNLSIKLDLNLGDLGVGQLCTILPQLGQLGLCDNPALQSCLTQLQSTSLADVTDLGSLQEVLDNVLTNCTGGVNGSLNTICKAVTSAQPQLAQLCALLGSLPRLTVPSLPIPVPSLSNLTRCLTSGKPSGAACDKINPLLLVQRCTATTRQHKPAGYYSATCKQFRKLNLGIVKGGVLGQLPIVGGGGGSGGGGGGGGGGLPGLPGLPSLPRAPFGTSSGARATASTGLSSTSRTSASSDLAAMLVWGMVQR